jgi:hypothetical protein
MKKLIVAVCAALLANMTAGCKLGQQRPDTVMVCEDTSPVPRPSASVGQSPAVYVAECKPSAVPHER